MFWMLLQTADKVFGGNFLFTNSVDGREQGEPAREQNNKSISKSGKQQIIVSSFWHTDWV